LVGDATPEQLTMGSLCTGIAGLELGLHYAGLNAKPVFVSDINPGVCDWLDQAMPYTPNLGDFTQLTELPAVDVLVAGFPCQPVSSAGSRKGTEDARWLWPSIADLVRNMVPRPTLFLENVSGLLLANGGHAMATVARDLAECGYRLEYGCMAAAAVGAAHKRNRWWGLAYVEDANSEPRHKRWLAASRRSQGNRARPDTGRRSRASAADTESTERHATQPASMAATVGTATEPRERNSPLPDRFGHWAPAIDRWARVLGRTAPDPTTPNGRIAPAFVEWMMGYPQGWVTDTDLTNSQALYALGNAVVPQAAAAAFTALAAREP